MSALNNSVIICDALPNSSQKNTSKKSKKQKDIVKRTYYENPLKHIQLSSKRYKQLQARQNQNGQKKKVNNNENNCFSSGNAALNQDSIIILSDNECESNSANNKNVYKHKENVVKGFFEELEKTIISYKNINESLKRKRPGVLTRSKRRKLLNSGVLLDNNSSSLFITDIEDSNIITVETDNENRAPLDSINQSSDDIVVVWSSASSNEVVIDEITESDQNETVTQKTQEEKISSQESNNRLFMIDCTPDKKNLQCLLSRKEKPKILENNIEKDIEKDDLNLLFNKPGLKLPTARNISETITMKKRKSLFNPLSQLEQKTSELNMQISLPSTSNENSENNYSAPLVQYMFNPLLREIVIDGNNVAMAYSKHKQFSEEGIQIVIDYFRARGHIVKVFIPQHRRSLNNPRLEKWYAEGIAVFTPSRYIAGRWITSYDDRFILQYATMCNGIVISMDQYRDLYNERIEWRNTIVNRLLVPTFVGNIVMFPDDPLGRNGPTLDQFLRHE